MAQAAVAEIMKPEKRIRAMALLLMLATTVEFVAIVHHPHVQSRDQLQATLQIIALEWRGPFGPQPPPDLGKTHLSHGAPVQLNDAL